MAREKGNEDKIHGIACPGKYMVVATVVALIDAKGPDRHSKTE